MKASHISILEINNLFNAKHSEIKITGASLDTRTLKKGNIFFAIKGKNSDGHKFINQAEKKGASIAFVQKINSKSNLKQIKVKNTLSALLSLAKYYRSLLNTQIIGITGSVGKTGTKDAISFILKEHKNIFCSRQSYNNKYGMPLEILNMPRKTKFGFFELGMNHSGEIKRLVKILKPNISIILNIENVHLGNFKSLKEIAVAKSEIFTSSENIDSLILNKETNYYNLLYRYYKNTKIKNIYNYSKKNNSNVYIKERRVTKKIIQLKVSLPGDKLVSFGVRIDQENLIDNCLAILTCLHALNIDHRFIKKFKNVPFTSGRGNMIRCKYNSHKLKLYDHSYNASPISMKQTIDIFDSLKEKNIVYLIGDMNELGQKASYYHTNLIKFLDKKKFEKCLFIGKHFKKLENKIHNNKISFFKDINQVIDNLDEIIESNYTIFAKGSNSINIRRLITHLKQENI